LCEQRLDEIHRAEYHALSAALDRDAFGVSQGTTFLTARCYNAPSFARAALDDLLACPAILAAQFWIMGPLPIQLTHLECCRGRALSTQMPETCCTEGNLPEGRLANGRWKRFRQEVVEPGNCTHSGACAGLNPELITFTETSYGPLPPMVRPEIECIARQPVEAR
jgi:hypothetical protein